MTTRTVTDVVGTAVLDDRDEADIEIAAEYLYAAAHEN